MKKHVVFGFVCLSFFSNACFSLQPAQKSSKSKTEFHASAIPTEGACMWQMFDHSPRFFPHDGCRLG